MNELTLAAKRFLVPDAFCSFFYVQGFISMKGKYTIAGEMGRESTKIAKYA